VPSDDSFENLSLVVCCEAGGKKRKKGEKKKRKKSEGYVRLILAFLTNLFYLFLSWCLVCRFYILLLLLVLLLAFLWR